MGPGAATFPGGAPHPQLADLVDYLLCAEQEHLHAPPPGLTPPAGHEPPLVAVFSAIREAFEHLSTWVSGPQLVGTTGVKIALSWSGPEVRLVIDEQTSSADIMAFTTALRRSDQRLLACAELIGLLLQLSLEWATAGFAPPAVLLSLHTSAPRILALSQAALAPPDS